MTDAFYNDKWDRWDDKFDKKWDDKWDDKCDKKWDDKCDKKWDDKCGIKWDDRCDMKDTRMDRKCGCLLVKIQYLQIMLSDILLYLITHPCDKSAYQCYQKTKWELKCLIKEFTDCCIR